MKLSVSTTSQYVCVSDNKIGIPDEQTLVIEVV